MMRLILASASPRRCELLRLLDLPFAVLTAEVPEHPAPQESAEAYGLRVAQAKAQAVLDRHPLDPGDAVLGADTEVILDGRIFGKPVDAEDAVAMLTRLSGRCHEVITALALHRHGRWHRVAQRSRVHMAALSPERIRAYVASGEPMGKAGAYAIQGRAAAFISHLEGSYSGVMGLPLYETSELLRAAEVI
jgi:septum formation protein